MFFSYAAGIGFVLCLYGIVTCLKIERSRVQTEKVCYGTNMGFSYSASLRRHYNFLRKNYKDCTYVHGNLEVTHLRHPNIRYDLSFLKTIRYVSGYVLIGLLTHVNEIPLTSLEIIRGNATFDLFGDDFSLIVTLTDRKNGRGKGLREVQLPALREISNGKILFSQNPSLCHVNTIFWNVITRGRYNAVIMGNKPFSEKCGSCSPVCELLGVRRCWGKSRNMCQKVDVLHFECDKTCPYRCFAPWVEGCCQSNCAGGCYGPTKRDCELCRDFRLGNNCVDSCPYDPRTYTLGQTCIRY